VLARSSVAAAPQSTMRARLITVANAAQPVLLAKYAPAVSTAFEAGDRVALVIVEEAVRLLANTAMAAREPDEQSPVVLVGSLVGPHSPVGDHLRAELTTRAGGPVRVATEGASGAAWLAAVDLLGPTAPRPAA